MIEEPKMLGRIETIRTIAEGLLPWKGDWYDFADGLELLLDGLWRWLHLLLRLVMMAAFPVTLAVLYPLVRMAQRNSLAEKKREAQARRDLIAKLTKLQKSDDQQERP